MLKKISKISIASVGLLPFLALAQDSGNSFNGQYVTDFLTTIGDWINILIPTLIGLALVVFFWGLVTYIWGGGTDKEKAKGLMIWGVVAIAIMVSIWGVVSLLQNVFGISGVDSSTLDFPAVPGIGEDL